MFSGDDAHNTSKFRRKLSQGLSLISLSQRKTTPVRPTLPINNLATASDVPNSRSHETTRLLSPMRELSSHSAPAVRKVTPNSNASSRTSQDPDTTPKPLPRSRTMSFIPRPSRSESESSVIESDSAATPRPPVLTLEEEARATPTKIPSPDLSAASRRKSSPRQYHPDLTNQQAKHIAAGKAFAGVKMPSPTKTSPVRSYTTPNLTQGAHSSGPEGFMSPRRSTQQRLSYIPAPQRQNVKENSTPATHRHIKRLSNIQEHSPSSPRREGLMAPTVASKRRSVGPTSAVAQSEHQSCTTPPASSKRKNSHTVHQTPLAAQRALPKKRSPSRTITLLSPSNGSAVTQTRLLGPVSPLTSAKNGHASPHGSLPRTSTERDLRKRTFSTPYKKMGGLASARGHAGVNNEVRLPRSSTYHFLGVLEDLPPVPPIPEKYKSVSMPLLVPLVEQKEPIPEPNPQEETNVLKPECDENSLRSTDSSFCAITAIPYIVSSENINFIDELRLSRKSLLPKSKSKLSIQIPSPGRTFSASSLFSAKSSELWSAKAPKHLDLADFSDPLQIKEYMPALYWAGRFQSRYDQWRTEAMQVELHPEYSMEGPLAHCDVHHEKAAVCHIFLQLRDLCSSHQAAESLWVNNIFRLRLLFLLTGTQEFEHRYRQDHNLLSTSLDLPPLNAKPEDPNKGSFGRAIRKMTPRKSSFVNLLKGKGWNADDVKSTDGSVDCDFATKSFASSEDDHK